MRLFRYAVGDTRPRLAAAVGERGPVDLRIAMAGAAGDEQMAHLFSSTALFIEGGPDLWAAAADAASRADADAMVPADARFLCPFDRIASLRDFLAFEDHVEGGARRRGTEVPAYWYEAPIYYKGNHRQLLGPDDVCPWPSYTDNLDFELELAMVVGKAGRDIDAANAGDHIFGFTVFNDFSARDVQSKEMSAWLGPGKGKDFANAFGPCIVTADEVGSDPDLEMTCMVNGEQWGRSRSSQMHWKWAEMIAHVSNGEDVYPGDVYGSGTPGGCCGLDLGRSLTPGDVVELAIEKVGTLRNAIGDRRPE